MTFPLNSGFPSTLRIRKSSDFKEVFGRGKRLHAGHYSVILASNSLGFPRLGLVVGKKKIGSSVRRNRVKRVLREIFRKNIRLFDSFDVLILPKKGSETLGYKEAAEEIAGVIKRKSAWN
jgi:ribonuclease P protein component